MKKILFFLILLFSAVQAETRFLYVRHGEVPGNDPNSSHYAYTGSASNDPLTEKGRLQAQEVAKTIFDLQEKGVIAPVTAVYASNLKRAVETAEPIAQKLGLTVVQRPDLREIYWGSADGQSVHQVEEQWGNLEAQVKQQYPDRKTRWDHLPVFEGAETYNALFNRSLKEFTAIGELHPEETIVIVGHGRVFKTVVAGLKDSEKNLPQLPNCAIAEFIYSSDTGVQFVKIVEK